MIPPRTDDTRPSPEEILERAAHAEPPRGRLKIFLGFAAGVGKTFEMLTEARRRRERGQDVVIGYVETHGRQATKEQIGDLPIVPRRIMVYRGSTFEEMDTDAVIERRPELALVDELAHTNVPGSPREKRWQDIEVLRDAGIHVLTAMNVQHLESLNDAILDITGIRVRETVPDQVLQGADEVVIVDITPRALIHRLERGDIYHKDKIPQARENWFREESLCALREIALREVAHEVDDEVEAMRRERRIAMPWATHDLIIACISPTQESLRLLRRAWRTARRLRGEVRAVYVEDHVPTTRERETLERDFALTARLEIPVVTLSGKDVAAELIRYARGHNVTQLVIGHSNRSPWTEFLKGSIVNRLTWELRNIDIVIVAAPSGEPDS